MAKEAIWKSARLQTPGNLTIGKETTIICELREEVDANKLQEIDKLEVLPNENVTLEDFEIPELSEVEEAKELHVRITPTAALEHGMITIQCEQFEDVAVTDVTIQESDPEPKKPTVVIPEEQIQVLGFEEIHFIEQEESQTAEGSFVILGIESEEQREAIKNGLHIRESVDSINIALELKDVAVNELGVIGKIVVTHTMKQDGLEEAELCVEEEGLTLSKKFYLRFVKHEEEAPKELVWDVKLNKDVMKNVVGELLPTLTIVNEEGVELLEEEENFVVTCPEGIEYSYGVLSGKFTHPGKYSFTVHHKDAPEKVKECSFTIEEPKLFHVSSSYVELDVTRNVRNQIALPEIPEGYEGLKFRVVHGDKVIAEVKEHNISIRSVLEGKDTIYVYSYGYLTQEEALAGTIQARVTDKAREEADAERRRLEEQKLKEQKEAEERHRQEVAARIAKYKSEEHLRKKKEIERKREIIREHNRRQQLDLPYIETEMQWVLKLIQGSGDPRKDRKINFKEDPYGWLSGRNSRKAMEEWKQHMKEKKEREMANMMTSKPIPERRTWDDDLITNVVNMAGDLYGYKSLFRIDGYRARRIFSWSQKCSPEDMDLTLYEVRALLKKGYTLWWLETPMNLPNPFPVRKWEDFYAIVKYCIENRILYQNV